MQNTFVVVDIASLYFCVNQKFQNKINYSKLLEKLKAKYNDIVRVIAYGVHDMNDTLRAEKFIAALSKLGFETRYGNSTAQVVQITLDTCKIMDRVRRVIFVSSNPGLLPLLIHLRDNGIEVELLSCGIPKSMKFLPYEEIDDTLIERRADETPAATE